MKDSDVPHRTKIREEILEKAKVAEERIRKHFKVYPLSLTNLTD